MLDKARYIVVEGPIGAGKTSLARRLADRLGAAPILEQAERNPFLGRFYQNMDRWSLATQLAFLQQRIETLGEIGPVLAGGGRVVSDFLLEKDPLFATLNLGEDECRLYRQIHQQLRPQPRTPDLVIYLQAKAETLAERVRRRGWEIERRLTEAYLGRVVDAYARFFFEFNASPLFIVDAERLNPVDDEADFELLLKHLGAMRGYREFFGYAV